MATNSTHPSVVRTSRGLSIVGTRITLYDILDYMHAGWPPTLIQHWLNLSEQQMVDAMEYIAAHGDQAEAEYQQVLQQAKANRVYWDERNRERIAHVRQLPPKPGQEAVIAKLRESKAKLGLS